MLLAKPKAYIREQVVRQRSRVMHRSDREACRGSRARLEVRRQVDLLAWTGCTMVSERRLEVGYLLLRFTLVSATRKQSARRCPALSFADRAWISMLWAQGCAMPDIFLKSSVNSGLYTEKNVWFDYSEFWSNINKSEFFNWIYYSSWENWNFDLYN